MRRYRPNAEGVIDCGQLAAFHPADFEYDFERDELAAHRVTFEEAVECFFSDFEVRRNKSYRDRYQLLGRTFGGRQLKIIFQVKPGNIVRIITGWDG